MNLKLSETARVDILASLDQQEATFNTLLKNHNENKPYNTKSLYIDVQGFDIKAISKSHAHKKIKSFLKQAGFHPSTTLDYMVSWRKQLNIKEVEDETEERKENT